MVARPQIFRTSRGDKSGAFSRGANAIGICHRSGFKVPYKTLKFEPGTGHLVSRSENDWNNSLVMHPQNFLPEKKTERIALRWVYPDTTLDIGVVVSADHLFLPPGYTSIQGQFFVPVCVGRNVSAGSSVGPGVSAGSSVGTGVSGGTLDFGQVVNSQYYLVIFTGI